MNSDYKNGYREGFLDGFKAARDNPYMTQPATPDPVAPSGSQYHVTNSCSVCGRSYVDSMGRLVPSGFVCGNIMCPYSVTSVSSI